MVEELAYWTFTDAMFEEGGPFRSPFQGPNYLNRDKGGSGPIATHNIPKAGFNALQLLHRLGDRRIPLDSESAILTQSSETQNLILALWNYCDPEAEGEEKSFRIQLADQDAYKREATIQLVDETHGNAAAAGISWAVRSFQLDNKFPSCKQRQWFRRRRQSPSRM